MASPHLAPMSAQGFADVNGVSLRYRIDGPAKAPAVVLLHEMGTSLESWDEVALQLAKRYRVLRYDIRGFGLSEKLTGPVKFPDERADLLELLDVLHVRRATLVGSALGGAIALDFAASHPERTAGVVAIGPAAYLEPRPVARASADAIEKTGIRRMISSAVDVIYPLSVRSTPERMNRFMGIQLATDPTSLAHTTRMVADTGFRETLPRIQAPALLAATSLFTGRKPDDIRQLSDLIPCGRFAQIPTGHLAAIESPDAVTLLIQNFLTAPARCGPNARQK